MIKLAIETVMIGTGAQHCCVNYLLNIAYASSAVCLALTVIRQLLFDFS